MVIVPFRHKYERCLYKIQHDYAMLTMEIATPRIIKTKKQLRFSFVDQLGTLGTAKTLQIDKFR